jgi:hypothetical protein
MRLLEACLSNCDVTRPDMGTRMSLLQRLGICDWIFPDFFSFKSFSQQIEESPPPSSRVHVILYPNIELIKMVWSIISLYASFTIFLRCINSLQEEEFKDALYYTFSLTDNVGCAIELESVLNLPVIGHKVQSLCQEFEINRFLCLDAEGLLLPHEVSKGFKMLRSKAPRHSEIFYFPNNQHGLGLVNAFNAMQLALDGLVGTGLGGAEKCAVAVDFSELYLLYRNKRENMFSKRSIGLLNLTFRSFAVCEEAKSTLEPMSHLC